MPTCRRRSNKQTNDTDADHGDDDNALADTDASAAANDEDGRLCRRDDLGADGVWQQSAFLGHAEKDRRALAGLVDDDDAPDTLVEEVERLPRGEITRDEAAEEGRR